MLTGQALLYFIYVVAAASVILAAEALYLSLAGRRSRLVAVNHRLRRLADEAPAEQTLQGLLRERGLTDSGDFIFGFVSLNRLYTQSGITGNPMTFAASFFLAGLASALLLWLFLHVAAPAAFIIFLVVGFALPVIVLRRARNRRIKKFAKQLPDALDMIVRSLRAGHPASVAIGLVAREIPDPLGTEFGISADASGSSQVRVFEGAVEVEPILARVNANTRKLIKAGQVGIIEPSNGYRESKAGVDSNGTFVRDMPNSFEDNFANTIKKSQPWGYWSFNSAITSTLIPDMSGHGRFAQLLKDAMVVQGHSISAIGQAASLNEKSSDSILIPTGSKFSTQKDFSVELLFAQRIS